MIARAKLRLPFAAWSRAVDADLLRKARVWLAEAEAIVNAGIRRHRVPTASYPHEHIERPEP